VQRLRRALRNAWALVGRPHAPASHRTHATAHRTAPSHAAVAMRRRAAPGGRRPVARVQALFGFGAKKEEGNSDKDEQFRIQQVRAAPRAGPAWCGAARRGTALSTGRPPPRLRALIFARYLRAHGRRAPLWRRGAARSEAADFSGGRRAARRPCSGAAGALMRTAPAAKYPVPCHAGHAPAPRRAAPVPPNPPWNKPSPGIAGEAAHWPGH
jgi:hypothetical protein